MSERPLTLIEHTLRRFARWMAMLEAMCGPYLGAARIPYPVRRRLFRELRNMERVARRLAWLMALEIDLPPLAPRARARARPGTATGTASAAIAPAAGRRDRPACLAMVEPLPACPARAAASLAAATAFDPFGPRIWSPGAAWRPLAAGPPGSGEGSGEDTGGPQRLPGAGVTPGPPGKVSRDVSPGRLARRLDALRAFAAAPERLARRLALWHRRGRAGCRSGRNAGRLLPVPVRPPPARSQLPQLADVLPWLQAHCRGDPGTADPPAPAAPAV